jgi:hypothetical protein
VSIAANDSQGSSIEKSNPHFGSAWAKKVYAALVSVSPLRRSPEIHNFVQQHAPATLGAIEKDRVVAVGITPILVICGSTAGDCRGFLFVARDVVQTCSE